MSSIEIRREALAYATNSALTYGSAPPKPEATVAAARAFEAYLVGTETDDGAEADLRGHTAAPSSPEPPVGSVVVLRSPQSGRLIPALHQFIGSGRWTDLTTATPLTWTDLIDGREIVAVHTPDGAS